MRDRELRRIVGSIVFAAFPTLALTTACRTSGEVTYVVRSEGRTCRDACQTLVGRGARGSWQTSEVMECVDAAQVDPDALGPTSGSSADEVPPPPAQSSELSTPVAVCRMRTRYTGGIGRRPEGLVLGHVAGRSAAGAYFARVEQLERAAGIAFERLADELVRLDAPRALVEAARRGVIEERRHAQIAARWRAHFGGIPAEIDCAAAQPARALLALARENVVEGCVHETWGAILAAAQAELAEDPMLRADLAAIARDEAGHAALSHRIDRWARTRLSIAAARELDEARVAAIRELATTLEDRAPELRAVGVPGSEGMHRLFRAACERLAWAA